MTASPSTADVGRTEDWLSRVENNKIELDRLSVIRRLADALDVSIGDLVAEPKLRLARCLIHRCGARRGSASAFERYPEGWGRD